MNTLIFSNVIRGQICPPSPPPPDIPDMHSTIHFLYIYPRPAFTWYYFMKFCVFNYLA